LQIGGKEFDCRRSASGFPEKLSKEFLLVELVNNLSGVAKDTDLIKEKIKKHFKHFNKNNGSAVKH
jgi:hypothetical protein